MNYRVFVALLLVWAVALTAVACGGDDPSVEPTPRPTPILTPVPSPTPVAATVNVVSAFDLRGTARIEVFELQVDGPGYLLRTVFSDAQVVDKLIAALDEELVLQSRVRCPENFRLRFFFAGGRTETLGLVCFSEPDLVRGDDAVFGFMDAPLPADFRLAFRTAMAVAPRPDPVASDRIVPLAISGVLSEHPELVEFTNFEYERLNLTPPMTLGASKFAYQSLDWRVEVSWAVVAKPVYVVKVMSLRTGFEWEGTFEDDQLARAPEITPGVPVISDESLWLVLERLGKQDAELEQLSLSGFHRYDLSPEGLVGFSRFGYQNADWELEISWPVVLEPVFSVVVLAPGTDFRWDGEVLMSELDTYRQMSPEAM